MAAKKSASTGGAYAKVKVRRKGIHAKSKTSKLKTSKNYIKQYKSQG
jgi:hypothetical protein